MSEIYSGFIPAHLAKLSYAPPTWTPGWAQFLLASKGCVRSDQHHCSDKPQRPHLGAFSALKKVHTLARKSHTGWDRNSLTPWPAAGSLPRSATAQHSLGRAHMHREGRSTASAHNWLLVQSWVSFLSAAQALRSTCAFPPLHPRTMEQTRATAHCAQRSSRHKGPGFPLQQGELGRPHLEPPALRSSVQRPALAGRSRLWQAPPLQHCK